MKTTIYKDKKGEYRWRIKADNNKIIAASTEGFKNSDDAIYNMNLVGKALNNKKPSLIIYMLFIGFIIGLLVSVLLWGDRSPVEEPQQKTMLIDPVHYTGSYKKVEDFDFEHIGK